MSALAGPQPDLDEPGRAACSRTSRPSAAPPSPSRRATRTSACAGRNGFARDPLPILLDAYERYGPVFTLRIFHGNIVFMLGPEANHYVLVSHASNFVWREGGFGDLIPLLGDGLLTIDGDFHRRSRRIMLPAFHRERIAARRTTSCDEETDAALDRWAPARGSTSTTWTRELALRIADARAVRLRPRRAARATRRGARVRAARWASTRRDYLLPDRCAGRARRAGGCCARARALDRRHLRRDRRGAGAPASAARTSSRCCSTRRTRTARGLSDQHIRDEVMTLLFAGHDTTTSTLAFLFYELAATPSARLLAEPTSARRRAPAPS